MRGGGAQSLFGQCPNGGGVKIYGSSLTLKPTELPGLLNFRNIGFSALARWWVFKQLYHLRYVVLFWEIENRRRLLQRDLSYSFEASCV